MRVWEESHWWVSFFPFRPWDISGLQKWYFMFLRPSLGFCGRLFNFSVLCCSLPGPSSPPSLSQLVGVRCIAEINCCLYDSSRNAWSHLQAYFSTLGQLLWSRGSVVTYHGPWEEEEFTPEITLDQGIRKGCGQV